MVAMGVSYSPIISRLNLLWGWEELKDDIISANTVCSTAATSSSCQVKDGLFFKQTSSSLTGSSISSNYFKYLNFGMEFYSTDPSTASNTVLFENTFRINTYGLNIASHERDISSGACGGSCGSNVNPSNPFNLEINCNDFHKNDVGIAGNGDIIDQGDPFAGIGGEVHENGFGYTNGDHNIDYDILWGDGFSTVKFYYKNQNFGSYSGLTGITYCVSCTTGQNSTPESSVQDDLCSPARQKKLMVVEESEDMLLTAFPNPFKEFVKLKVDFENPVHLIIFDLQGKVVFQDQNLDPGTHTIPSSKLKKGLYIVKAISRDGEQNSLKIIKL